MYTHAQRYGKFLEGHKTNHLLRHATDKASIEHAIHSLCLLSLFNELDKEECSLSARELRTALAKVGLAPGNCLEAAELLYGHQVSICACECVYARMCSCVYVYLWEKDGVCVYIYIWQQMYACSFVLIFVRLTINTRICMELDVRVCIWVCVFTHACVSCASYIITY